MESFESLLSWLSDIVWGPPMLILLFGTHLFLTFRLKFIQRYLGEAIKISLEKDKEGEGDVSQFGALTTALAATIGTGNIIGVGTAVAVGGPGAVLWMWLTGVFGIATKYSEALLSVKYRVTTPKGEMAGGPMYVLERGMNQKWLGIIFAALTAVAGLGIGCMVQANSISSLAQSNFGVSPWISGILMTILTAVVILGGIKSIATVCEYLVPFMAIFYVGGCLVLLFLKIETVPATILLIIQSAFSGQAAVGGFLGAGMLQAMRFGVARGLFSNESGLGSAPIVAASAQTKNPVRQALVSSTGTFWDTVVVCLMTGLVLVNSGDWKDYDFDKSKVTPEQTAALEKAEALGPAGLAFDKVSTEMRGSLIMGGVWKKANVDLEKLPAEIKTQAQTIGALKGNTLDLSKAPVDLQEKLGRSEGWKPAGLKGDQLTNAAFSRIPFLGQLVLTIGLLTFVFSTILGWSYYGEKAAEYLFGTGVVLPYRIIWVICVLLGSVVPLKMVWDFADVANGLMAIPNLISLLFLNKVLVEETKKYLWDGGLDEMQDPAPKADEENGELESPAA